MDDLISRKAAIDALGERPMVWTNEDEYALGERSQYDIDRLAIETVPSAQPEKMQFFREGATSDCISRQAAIDFIDAGHLVNPNEPRWSDNEVVAFLKSRPSAQPEPKSPLYYGDGYSEGKMVYDSAECPNCGYIYDEGDQVWGEPYCPHCGQALDWYMRGEQDE